MARVEAGRNDQSSLPDYLRFLFLRLRSSAMHRMQMAYLVRSSVFKWESVPHDAVRCALMPLGDK